MKSDKLSLRQITVLTVTGLLAPGADLLPGLLARQAGRAGWTAMLLALPVVAAWLFMLMSLFKESGTCLGGALKQRFGRAAGTLFSLLYIMWAVVLAGETLARAEARMEAVYESGMNRWLAAALLVLVLWMVLGKTSGLCRAAELFWPVMAVAVAAILLLSLPQIRGERLLPSRAEWGGVPGAWLDCLGVLGGGILAAAPLAAVPGSRRKHFRLLGWGAGACLLLAALAAAVVGQVGSELTGKLEHPFFIMVQGLSLEGGFARLEAPAAAVWLLADFAAAAVPLLAVRTLAGERIGKWAAVCAGVLAWTGKDFFPAKAGIFGGIFLGFGVPILLWALLQWRSRRG